MCKVDYETQAEVIRFAVDAVRAEAFNARTLFLFGSYTIGKERLFLEVARQLSMKVQSDLLTSGLLNEIVFAEGAVAPPDIDTAVR